MCQFFKKTNVQIQSNTAFKRKDAQTDKHEFIGPFQLKPGFPKKAEVTFLVENISILSNSGKVPGESL